MVTILFILIFIALKQKYVKGFSKSMHSQDKISINKLSFDSLVHLRGSVHSVHKPECTHIKMFPKIIQNLPQEMFLIIRQASVITWYRIIYFVLICHFQHIRLFLLYSHVMWLPDSVSWCGTGRFAGRNSVGTISSTNSTSSYKQIICYIKLYDTHRSSGTFDCKLSCLWFESSWISWPCWSGIEIFFDWAMSFFQRFDICE